MQYLVFGAIDGDGEVINFELSECRPATREKMEENSQKSRLPDPFSPTKIRSIIIQCDIEVLVPYRPTICMRCIEPGILPPKRSVGAVPKHSIVLVTSHS